MMNSKLTGVGYKAPRQDEDTEVNDTAGPTLKELAVWQRRKSRSQTVIIILRRLSEFPRE